MLSKIVDIMLSDRDPNNLFVCRFDQAFRNKECVDQLMSTVPKEFPILVSGKFGQLVAERFDVVVLPGGVRYMDELKVNLEPIEYIFVDDGIYTCSTVSKIKDAVERNGGKLRAAYVVFQQNDIQIIPTYALYTNEQVMEEYRWRLMES